MERRKIREGFLPFLLNVQMFSDIIILGFYVLYRFVMSRIYRLLLCRIEKEI